MMPSYSRLLEINESGCKGFIHSKLASESRQIRRVMLYTTGTVSCNIDLLW